MGCAPPAVVQELLGLGRTCVLHCHSTVLWSLALCCALSRVCPTMAGDLGVPC